MRVRIDKAGHNHLAGCVKPFFCRIGLEQTFAWPNGFNQAATNQHRGFCLNAKASEGFTDLRSACQGQKLGDVGDKHGGDYTATPSYLLQNHDFGGGKRFVGWIEGGGANFGRMNVSSARNPTSDKSDFAYRVVSRKDTGTVV